MRREHEENLFLVDLTYKWKKIQWHRADDNESYSDDSMWNEMFISIISTITNDVKNKANFHLSNVFWDE